MKNLDPVLLLSAIPVVLAIPGLVAFYWQLQDRRERKRTAHFPPELRPALATAISLARKVQAGKGAEPDMKQAIETTKDELDRIASIIGSGHLYDWSVVNNVRGSLFLAGLSSRMAALESATPAEVAHEVQDAKEAAAVVIALAELLLRRMPPPGSHG